MRTRWVGTMALCLASCGSDPFVGLWKLSESTNVAIQTNDGGVQTDSCSVAWLFDIRAASPGYDIGWFGCQLTATEVTGNQLSFVNGGCVIDGGTLLPGISCPDGALSGEVCGWSTQMTAASRLTVVGSTLSFTGGVHGTSICSGDVFDYEPQNPMSGTRQ
jgi:hypothetical protein